MHGIKITAIMISWPACETKKGRIKLCLIKIPFNYSWFLISNRINKCYTPECFRNLKNLLLTTYRTLCEYLLLKNRLRQSFMVSSKTQVKGRAFSSKKDSSVLYILPSQNRPPNKNEQEHLNPDNVLIQCPCPPHAIFAKQ